MKKILPIFLLFLIVFATYSHFVFSQVKQLPKASIQMHVQAAVGGLYFSVQACVAPNASIVLTIDNIFARATVADEKGCFYISDVMIKPGFSNFCLDAIDFKRLGESYTCFNIPPANQSVTMKDIFLSPTLGLSRTEIAEGSSATAWGYSLPGALVRLYLSNGTILTTYADATGYYQFIIKNLKAGDYSLYTRAELNHKQSVEPTKKLKLKSLSSWEQFINFLKDLWNKLMKFLTNLALGPLWLIIPILILIIILLGKLIAFDPFGRKHPLHHKWWMGY